MSRTSSPYNNWLADLSPPLSKVSILGVESLLPFSAWLFPSCVTLEQPVAFPRKDVLLSLCPGTEKFSCPSVSLSRDKGRSKNPRTNSSVLGQDDFILSYDFIKQSSNTGIEHKAFTIFLQSPQSATTLRILTLPLSLPDSSLFFPIMMLSLPDRDSKLNIKVPSYYFRFQILPGQFFYLNACFCHIYKIKVNRFGKVYLQTIIIIFISNISQIEVHRD